MLSGISGLRWVLFAITLVSLPAVGQTIPKTPGETLSGNHVVLAEEVRGHATVLVAGFSREGGNGTGAWVKAIHSDGALAGFTVYQVAMLGGAPGFIRGMIKRSMKKNVPEGEQDHFIVITEDEAAWRRYFDVSDDKVPYVAIIDSSGKMLWNGHGTAELEPQLKSALHGEQ